MGYREIDVCDECGHERDKLKSGYSLGGWIRLGTGVNFPNGLMNKQYDFCKYVCLIKFLTKVSTEANKEIVK